MLTTVKARREHLRRAQPIERVAMVQRQRGERARSALSIEGNSIPRRP
jgi:hypothetical protein